MCRSTRLCAALAACRTAQTVGVNEQPHSPRTSGCTCGTSTLARLVLLLANGARVGFTTLCSCSYGRSELVLLVRCLVAGLAASASFKFNASAWSSNASLLWRPAAIAFAAIGCVCTFRKHNQINHGWCSCSCHLRRLAINPTSGPQYQPGWDSWELSRLCREG
jgi:hypothetical protein